MIIVQLKGGFGNQLFQYAAAFSLAKHKGVEVKVDTSNLMDQTANDTARNYELQHLIAPPQVATAEEVYLQKNQSLLEKYFEKLLPSYKRKIYKEAGFEFDQHFFDAHSQVYVKGYRQSEKYFSTYEHEIRSRLQLQKNLIQPVEYYTKELNQSESVSIHIRRGDYHQQHINDYHGVLPQEYYNEAIALIRSKLTNPTFYIFSDNPQWVKEHLALEENTVFVSGVISTTHYQDFYLMSQCKHNIIANSSFSWWSAWLNTNLNKIIIAPQKWFNNTSLNTKDLIPPAWIKV